MQRPSSVNSKMYKGPPAGTLTCSVPSPQACYSQIVRQLRDDLLPLLCFQLDLNKALSPTLSRALWNRMGHRGTGALFLFQEWG